MNARLKEIAQVLENGVILDQMNSGHLRLKSLACLP